MAVTAKSLDLRLYTLEGKLDTVANNIVRFERQSAQALTLAQKASTLASRLAPLLRIVGIVANILAIIEQVAVIQTFAFRMDKIEEGFDKHDAELTRQNGLLGSARKRLSTLEKKTRISTTSPLRLGAMRRRLWWVLVSLHLKSVLSMISLPKQKPESES